MSLKYRVLCLSCAFSACIAFSPDTARALSENDKQAVRALSTQAQSEYEQGRYEQAAQDFQHAYAIAKVPTLAVLLARTNVKLKRLVAASELYTEAMQLEKSDLWKEEARQRQAQEDAQTELEALKPRIPQLKIQVEDVSSAYTLKVDGQPIPSAMAGVDRPTDPGTHTVELIRNGKKATETITLSEGQSGSVTLRDAQGASGVSARFPAPPDATDDSASSDASPDQSSLGRAHDDEGRIHEGFYFRVGIGPGSINAKLTEPGVSVSFDNAGVMLELAGGWTIANRYIVGLGLYDSYLSKEKNGATLTSSSAILGPMIDIYPSPTGGFHVQGSVGPAFGTVTVTGAPDLSLSGWGVMVASGYEAWVSRRWALGGELMILDTSTKGKDTGVDADVNTVAVGVLFTATAN